MIITASRKASQRMAGQKAQATRKRNIIAEMRQQIGAHKFSIIELEQDILVLLQEIDVHEANAAAQSELRKVA